VTAWPTAELHVHLEGTLEVELLVELALAGASD
jgi:adenosine deaminase